MPAASDDSPASTPEAGADRTVSPTSLKVVAGIAALQGLLMVGLAVAELASFNSARFEMGVTTALFFAAAGVALLVCARGLWQARPWGRGPVLFAQLVQLGLAWNLRDGQFLWLAVVMAVVALVAIGCLVQKQSIAALEAGRE
jgi:hypothetical protein